MRTITLKRLPLENLKRKPLRTAALIVVSACLSAIFFGGSLISMNLERGLNSMRERMGADIMVIPQGTHTKAEALLTNSGSSTFYFTNNIENLVRRSPGVQKASAQTYISSLSAGCCAEKLQIIGFDPDSDFVIGPWIYSQHKQKLQKGEMIAGANVIVSYMNTVRLFGHQWPVAAQLAKTGTSIDNSVFVRRESVPQVVEYSTKVGHTAIPKEYAKKAVSAVLVKVQKGYSAKEVAKNIRKTTGLSSIGIVFPGGITATTQANLGVFTRTLTFIIAACWLVGLLVLVAVFSTSVNERKKEFASLRILGTTRNMLLGVVVRESTILGLVGGVLGVASASLILFPYSSLISEQLQLPYLEVTALPVAVLMLASVLLALVAVVVASALTTLRIAMRETYLTLRSGE
ncbi:MULTISPECIES: FtsX-like permease family protein [Gardnerella]|uniref:ABC transporter permease n=1 Tax=Gardnerella vaginalis TaxID=2702 RepID=A0AAP8ISY7_GARVA|nr:MULTISPECIES: FtsX-like permease family protein [Gardnerella]NSX31411.1 FtsX-like permease family protein [Gardnerella vaginalis]PKZ59704.1 ABC transporter permease [Gardnerella vaginalis]